MKNEPKWKKNRHHIKNRSKNGPPVPENLLNVKIERHSMLHVIFGNLDFYEIILLLIRVCRAKGYDKVNPKVAKFYKFV